MRALQKILSSELLVALAIVLRGRCNRSRNTEEFSATSQVFRAVAVAEKAIVADPLEAIREDMQQEAPQELVGR